MNCYLPPICKRGAYFKNNKNVTIDYDPTSCDTFIIEEDLFPIRFTNCLIFSGFVLVCCAALFII